MENARGGTPVSVPRRPAVLADVLGPPVTTLGLSADEVRGHLLGRGEGEAVADGAAQGSACVRRGGNAVVTEDLPELPGRPARTYREGARDHREAFGAG
ncbi:hypothetical protein OHS71_09875 [Streptomyces sp. NBC_00377]|uniref:hypothetical protein n=1 Tax=unclassified Streptomyces TaxID=2593676 RepID=UPI002E1A7B4D|nr:MULTISPECIES: hypothetical protein [unclassified Streptomyces]